MAESSSLHDEYVSKSTLSHHSTLLQLIKAHPQIVYIPTLQPKPAPSTPTTFSLPPLQSFACPLTHIHDTRVTAPWFGPNEVLSLIQPVPNGGIPPHHPAIKLTLTFRDGGAYDFHTKFVQVKERLQQALEVRGMAGHGIGADGGSAGQAEALAAASADVTLEDLPAYQETDAGAGSNAQEPMIAPTARRVTRQQQEEPLVDLGTSAAEVAADPPLSVPSDAPPGYEEAQSSGVSRAFER